MIVAFQHICPDRTLKNENGHPAHEVRKVGFQFDSPDLFPPYVKCPNCGIKYGVGVATVVIDLPKPDEKQ